MVAGAQPIEGPIGHQHLPLRACRARGLRRPSEVALTPPVGHGGSRSAFAGSSVVDPTAGSRPLPAVVDRMPVHVGRVDDDAMVLTGPLPVAESVGKILGPMYATGTGFLIGPDLLMTSRHVVVDIGDIVGTRVAFGWEYGVDVAEVVRVAPPQGEPSEHGLAGTEFDDRRFDVAVLRLDRAPSSGEVITPGMPPDEDAVVAAIGYPNEAGDENVSDAAAILLLGGPDLRGRKRASPGLLRTVTNSELLHDCSTMPGSSGSPLVDLSTGHVVGLHRGRVPRSDLPRNLAMPLWAIVERLPACLRRDLEPIRADQRRRSDG
ncbi:MAG: serine protease [Actinomycetota bacterium]